MLCKRLIPHHCGEVVASYTLIARFWQAKFASFFKYQVFSGKNVEEIFPPERGDGQLITAARLTRADIDGLGIPECPRGIPEARSRVQSPRCRIHRPLLRVNGAPLAVLVASGRVDDRE